MSDYSEFLKAQRTLQTAAFGWFASGEIVLAVSATAFGPRPILKIAAVLLLAAWLSTATTIAISTRAAARSLSENHRVLLVLWLWVIATCSVIAFIPFAFESSSDDVPVTLNNHESRIASSEVRLDKHESKDSEQDDEISAIRAQVARLIKDSTAQVKASRDEWDSEFPLGWGVVYANNKNPIYKDQSESSEIRIDWTPFRIEGVFSNGMLIFDPPNVTMPGIGANSITRVQIDSSIGSEGPIGIRMKNFQLMARVVLSDGGRIGVLFWLEKVALP